MGESLPIRPNVFAASLITLVALAAFAVPSMIGLEPHVVRGLALVLFAIGLYATQAVPEAVASLTFFTVAMLTGVAPATAVFQGFQSTALWLVFGGLVIGVAVERTGLGAYIAHRVTSRFGTRYPQLVVGMVVIGVVLCFIMPSTMGRVMLMVPLVVAICDKLGYARGSKGRSGLLLALACGTWMPSAGILPANLPNMVLSGMAEQLYGLHLTYGSYFLLQFPIAGLARATLIVVLVLWLYPEKSRARDISEDGGEPLSTNGRWMAAALLITLAFWATDFLHHISPAWIALACAVFCLWPRPGLVPMREFSTRVNFASVIYVAGILGLAAVLVSTGGNKTLGTWLIHHLPLSPGADFQNFYSLVVAGMAVSATATAPNVPAILGPLSADLAHASQLPLLTVMMTQVVGYSTVLLPYQAPPIIVAMQLAGVPMREGARITLILAVVSLVGLIPLNFLWWKLLGYFP